MGGSRCGRGCPSAHAGLGEAVRAAVGALGQRDSVLALPISTPWPCRRPRFCLCARTFRLLGDLQIPAPSPTPGAKVTRTSQARSASPQALAHAGWPAAESGGAFWGPQRPPPLSLLSKLLLRVWLLLRQGPVAWEGQCHV